MVNERSHANASIKPGIVGMTGNLSEIRTHINFFSGRPVTYHRKARECRIVGSPEWRCTGQNLRVHEQTGQVITFRSSLPSFSKKEIIFCFRQSLLQSLFRMSVPSAMFGIPVQLVQLAPVDGFTACALSSNDGLYVRNRIGNLLLEKALGSLQIALESKRLIDSTAAEVYASHARQVFENDGQRLLCDVVVTAARLLENPPGEPVNHHLFPLSTVGITPNRVELLAMAKIVLGMVKQYPTISSFPELEPAGSSLHQEALCCKHEAVHGEWIEFEMRKDRLAWVVVCGYRVIASGKTFSDMPAPAELQRIGEVHGVHPYLYQMWENKFCIRSVPPMAA